MRYELATLVHHPLHTARVAGNAHAYVNAADATGNLLGCWFTDARLAIRARSYAEGIWPPKGAPEQFFSATSALAYPLDFSPLR